jgi:hypothetical protein
VQCISHDDPEIECAGEVHEHRSRSGCTVAERCERHQALHDQHMNAVEAGLNEPYPGWNTPGSPRRPGSTRRTRVSGGTRTTRGGRAMPRTARSRVRFVETTHTVMAARTFRDYKVEVRRGQVCETIGRICGSPGAWNALPVGAEAWSRWHRTRADALRALQAREDFRDVSTYIPT